MPFAPDLTDPRYLDEVGWFLYHEKYGRNEFGGSYDAERREHNPTGALKEIRRILNNAGALFLSVDLRGAPNPAGPTLFSAKSLQALRLKEQFEIMSSAASEVPHSAWRHSIMRFTARKKAQDRTILEKEQLLRRYTARLGEHG